MVFVEETTKPANKKVFRESVIDSKVSEISGVLDTPPPSTFGNLNGLHGLHAYMFCSKPVSRSGLSFSLNPRSFPRPHSSNTTFMRRNHQKCVRATSPCMSVSASRIQCKDGHPGGQPTSWFKEHMKICKLCRVLSYPRYRSALRQRAKKKRFRTVTGVKDLLYFASTKRMEQAEKDN